MSYEITDSVLKRHHDQHVSTGGAPVASSFDRKANDAAVAASTAATGVAATTAAIGANNTSSTSGSTASDAATGATGSNNASGSTGGGGFLKWLAPLAIIGALIWAAFTFLMPGAKDAATGAADQAAEGAAAVTDTAKDAATGAANTATNAASDAAGTLDPDAVGEQVGGLFSSATDTLSGITDADSATAALPALGDLGTQVDSVSGMLDKLPKAARGPISSIASGGMESLQPVLDKVSALPGVGAIIEPVIGPIMEKLSGFGG